MHQRLGEIGTSIRGAAMMWTLRFLIIVGVAATATLLAAQSLKPGFEVASIRRHVNSELGGSFVPRGGTLVITSASVVDMVKYAYQVTDEQLLGGPAWIREYRYDVNAKAPEGVPMSEARPMLQALLESRFRLVLRHDVRERQVYAFVVARRDGRLGSKLVRSTIDC
jgi:uncharacterized protein (TIGR03435 family)